jgi:hypothetical protein
MKKPAAAKKAVPAKAAPKKAAAKAAPKKKPAAKKPVAGKKGAPAAGSGKAAPVTAHQAHLAHLAHLQRLGIRPKPAAKHQRRMLALGDGVACCAAEALAASLRLTGRPVSDADVLALYRRTADDPDTGATIVATLEAASRFGLGGLYPRWMPVRDPLIASGLVGADLAALAEDEAIGRAADEASHGLILGVDLPGPHAVLDDGTGWWSWGELYDPACWPDAVIEEAWAIEWVG